MTQPWLCRKLAMRETSQWHPWTARSFGKPRIGPQLLHHEPEEKPILHPWKKRCVAHIPPPIKPSSKAPILASTMPVKLGGFHCSTISRCDEESRCFGCNVKGSCVCVAGVHCRVSVLSFLPAFMHFSSLLHSMRLPYCHKLCMHRVQDLNADMWQD